MKYLVLLLLISCGHSEYREPVGVVEIDSGVLVLNEDVDTCEELDALLEERPDANFDEALYFECVERDIAQDIEEESDEEIDFS